MKNLMRFIGFISLVLLPIVVKAQVKKAHSGKTQVRKAQVKRLPTQEDIDFERNREIVKFRKEAVEWLSSKINLYGEDCGISISEDGSKIIISESTRTKENVEDRNNGEPYTYSRYKTVNTTFEIPFSFISRVDTHEWDGFFHGSYFTIYTFGKMITQRDESGKTIGVVNSAGFPWACQSFHSEENLLAKFANVFKGLTTVNNADMDSQGH